AVYRRAADRLDLQTPPRLLTSAQLHSPLFLGVWRPCIVLPQLSLTDWTAEQVECMALHELCHWRRRDGLVLAAQHCATTAYWWNWLWTRASQELDEVRELLCDEHASTAASSPVTYVETLLRLARRSSQPQPAQAILFAAPHQQRLADRVERLLAKPTSNRNTSSAWRIALVAGGVAWTTMAFASTRIEAVADDLSSGEVAEDPTQTSHSAPLDLSSQKRRDLLEHDTGEPPVATRDSEILQAKVTLRASSEPLPRLQAWTRWIHAAPAPRRSRKEGSPLTLPVLPTVALMDAARSGVLMAASRSGMREAERTPLTEQNYIDIIAIGAARNLPLRATKPQGMDPDADAAGLRRVGKLRELFARTLASSPPTNAARGFPELSFCQLDFVVDWHEFEERLPSVFDEWAGYKGAFVSVTEGLEKDPFGPQFSWRRLLSLFRSRLVVALNDHVRAERSENDWLAAIEINNDIEVAALLAAIAKTGGDQAIRLTGIDAYRVDAGGGYAVAGGWLIFSSDFEFLRAAVVQLAPQTIMPEATSGALDRGAGNQDMPKETSTRLKSRRLETLSELVETHRQWFKVVDERCRLGHGSQSDVQAARHRLAVSEARLAQEMGRLDAALEHMRLATAAAEQLLEMRQSAEKAGALTFEDVFEAAEQVSQARLEALALEQQLEGDGSSGVEDVPERENGS
ncbi:MAG: hypothetical protein KDA61_04725, partial [Planctomycetales bacterium]|nr:hypothetical protein [Planctomycetales bacterium]